MWSILDLIGEIISVFDTIGWVFFVKWLVDHYSEIISETPQYRRYNQINRLFSNVIQISYNLAKQRLNAVQTGSVCLEFCF